MIISLEKIYPDVVQKINASPYCFYLTGSRFFGTGTNLSDYDFFTTYSYQVKEFLTNLGFKHLSTSDHLYNDHSIVSIFRYENNVSSNFTWVDVQLVYSAEIKYEAQKLIFDEIGSLSIKYNDISKDAMNSLWNEKIEEVKERVLKDEHYHIK